MVRSLVSSLSLLLQEDEDELLLGSWAALSPHGGFSEAPPSFSFRLSGPGPGAVNSGGGEVVQVRPQPVQAVAAEAAVEAVAEP